ncbi:hypothetical protein ACFLQR_01155 [Verrucomicrobiota bacterium]
MKQITKLYLFIHPMPRRTHTRQQYMAKWEKLIIDQGPNEENAICILSNAPKEMEKLKNLAQRYFGQRCIIDPDDNSVETKLLLAEDLERTFRGRGCYNEWLPYEIWSSIIARKWTEGLKKNLDNVGFKYKPEHLHVVTCGQQWGGCLTKYSTFMAKYLGLTEPPDLRADLSPDAGWPIKATFVERIEMDRHVYLFLFKMPDGRPMAQYMDGLRAVWEPPHIATVQLNASRVEIVTTSPNLYLKVNEAAKVIQDTIIADVGDGCHPAITTLVGTKIEYEEFRESLTNAKITPRNDRCSVLYMAGYLDPVTTSRGDE